MHLSRLLKKKSEKSLTKTKSGSSLEPPPPMPQTVPSGASPRLPPPPPPPAPQDELSISLQASWKSATTELEHDKADKLLEQAEGLAERAAGLQEEGKSALEKVETALDPTGLLEKLEDGINSLVDGMPVFMSALDEVAKLHPFRSLCKTKSETLSSVAVMAFKAVWALEQKRRSNDKKILSLHVEMKSMMEILVQLKSVKDVEAVAPDGSTIKGRMQGVIMTAAEDIKACSNACDTYVKKKLIVKVLKGPIWESRLAAFTGTFTKRRSEFELAMAIHTSLGVDAANRAINSVDETTRAINAKIDAIMTLFAHMASPEQKDMSRLIDQRGGVKVLDDDKALSELNNIENRIYSQGSSGKLAGKSGTQLSDLKNELEVDPDAAIDANMEKFSRKLAVQQRQIVEELSHAIEREGDRIIGAILAGPHDRIIDPNVHAVWKDMGWRGSVKARHFVMALRDHYQEDRKHKRAETLEPGKDEFIPPIPKEDEWTLEFIDVVRLQAISEAFDDDASGFVTISEVNTFTTMRPLDWSLPRWIAYWAVGHYQTLRYYANEIKEIFAKMFAILPHIHPENKSAVNRYLKDLDKNVLQLMVPFGKGGINAKLQAQFQSYVSSEEERIRGNLEAIEYDIDDFATMELVAGEGRIEKHLLPLLSLILKRHFEIFRVCQTHVIHPDELWDAKDTIGWVFDAVWSRLDVLRTVFRQQKLDPAQQLKSFSMGLFEYLSDQDAFEKKLALEEIDFEEYPYEESLEEPLAEPRKILTYSFDQESLDVAAYDPPTLPLQIDCSTVLPGVADLLSHRWHGFIYGRDIRYPNAGMISMTFTPTFFEGGVQHFTASDRANMSDFVVVGECRVSEDPTVMTISFTRTVTRYPTAYFHGTWKIGSNTLSGTFGLTDDPSTDPGEFIFKQIDPENVCCMPAPVELRSGKGRALWSFAIFAVLSRIRRNNCSWAFLKERRDNRKRFIELYIRSEHATVSFGKPLDDGEEWTEFTRLKKGFTNADSRWYHSLAERQIRATIEHAYIGCDVCSGTVGGARVTCLTCLIEGRMASIDFDDSPICVGSPVARERDNIEHQPHHDLVKLRRVVHDRYWTKTFREAKAALMRGRGFLTTKAQCCANCGLSVNFAAPCWFCVQCPDETFVCWECDAKGEAGVAKLLERKVHDYYMHDLVRVKEAPMRTKLSVEQRVESMEEAVRKVEVLVKGMDERIERIEKTVEERMARVEMLLAKLVGE
uniref:Vacuolar protein sorting-associated protein 13 second N-terminal domain-containing protein n=1 Tax=Mycena chlorophos TaxID=658473 RepID=A0ABQ0L167_MYCCL|nr:predicted protein [Mycena chlorophos]